MNSHQLLWDAAQLMNTHLNHDALRIKDHIYPMRGGWEGWAQVELAVILKRELKKEASGDVKVFREDRTLYSALGRNWKADLVFQLPVRGPEGETAYFHLIAELKCQRVKGQISSPEWDAEDDKFKAVNNPANHTSAIGILCLTCLIREQEHREVNFLEYKKHYAPVSLKNETIQLYARYYGKNTAGKKAGAALPDN